VGVLPSRDALFFLRPKCTRFRFHPCPPLLSSATGFLQSTFCPTRLRSFQTPLRLTILFMPSVALLTTRKERHCAPDPAWTCFFLIPLPPNFEPSLPRVHVLNRRGSAFNYKPWQPCQHVPPNSHRACLLLPPPSGVGRQIPLLRDVKSSLEFLPFSGSARNFSRLSSPAGWLDYLNQHFPFSWARRENGPS